MAATPGWTLSDEERAYSRRQLADSLSSIRFHLQRADTLCRGGTAMTAEEELAAIWASATDVEARAHADAGVMARTTSGNIPHEQAVQFYASKCSQWLLEMVADPDIIVRSAGAGNAVVADGLFDLSEGNRRGFLTGEKAKEAFAPMLREDAGIVKAVFSSKSFGVDAASVARDALATCADTLTELDASDVIAGRDEAEALAALRVLCEGVARTKIARLDLSDNAMGEKGLRACADALRLPSLRHLSLHNVGASPDAVRALDELLGDNAANLTGLRLKNNMSDDEGALSIARIVSRAQGLEEFKMASSRVKEAGCVALCKALSGCASLKSLDLSDNPFCDEASPAVSECIRGKTGMRVFALNDMNLGDDGAAAVVKALSASADTLEVLELGGNELTKRTAKLLTAAIFANAAHLKTLVLADNELKDAGAIAIAGLLPKSLEVLDMTTCEIGKDGAVAIAQAAKELPRLVCVKLDGNFIADDGVDQIRELLGDTLGSLEDNDPDGYFDDDEEDDDVDELSEVLSKQKI